MAAKQSYNDADICKDAEKFAKLFYEAFDNRRAQVNKMYKRDACMVWNGNPIVGQEAIANFLNGLPASEHNIQCLDAQSVSEKVSREIKSILLQSAGHVKYQERVRSFTQTFILTTENDLLKIASDRFRFID